MSSNCRESNPIECFTMRRSNTERTSTDHDSHAAVQVVWTVIPSRLVVDREVYRKGAKCCKLIFHPVLRVTTVSVAMLAVLDQQIQTEGSPINIKLCIEYACPSIKSSNPHPNKPQHMKVQFKNEPARKDFIKARNQPVSEIACDRICPIQIQAALTAVNYGRGEMGEAQRSWKGINKVDQQTFLTESYLKNQLKWPPRVRTTGHSLFLSGKVLTTFWRCFRRKSLVTRTRCSISRKLSILARRALFDVLTFSSMKYGIIKTRRH